MSHCKPRKLETLGRNICVALAILSLPVMAHELCLGAVVGSGPFVVGDLKWSNFEVTITGDLSADLSRYEISFSDHGFSLAGPLSAADGELGDLLLSYTVTSLTHAFASATLFANNAASGTGAQAAVDEVITDAVNGIALGTLSTFDTGGLPDEAVLQDSLSLGANILSLSVVQNSLLDSSLVGPDLGGSARISFIEQRFATVPEVETAALLGLGLLGLARAGSRQRALRHRERHRADINGLDNPTRRARAG
jgi:hypothetical protein